MRRLRSTRPFWMLSKFGGVCSRCKLGFKKGEEIFFYPATRTALAGCPDKPALLIDGNLSSGLFCYLFQV